MAEQETTVEELQKKIDEMQNAFQKRLNEQKDKYEGTVQQLTKELESKTAQTQQSGDAVTQLQSRIEELSQKMTEQEKMAATATRQALQARIGAATGLPADFYDLLSGEDEAAIAAHAQRLAEYLKPATPGNLPRLPQQQAQPAFTAEQMNDPAWVRENSQKILAAARPS